jgi:hypothetical protein
MSEAGESLPDLNLVLADADRRLTRLAPTPPINFRFQWQGIPFAARVVVTDDGATRLRLVGDLGPVPYSAENPRGRDRLMSLVQWRGAAKPCRFAMGQRQHLNLLGDTDVAAPLTGTAIIAAAAKLLLQARPHLDLAAEQRLNRERHARV